MDGSSWTEVSDLAVGRGSCGRSGTTQSALAMGGDSPGPAGGPRNAATEEWVQSVGRILTVTTS